MIDYSHLFHAFIKDVNTDRGTQFYSNHPKSKSQFQEFLEQNDINFVPSRKNNPQTNGKMERFWYEYDKHGVLTPLKNSFNGITIVCMDLSG